MQQQSVPWESWPRKPIFDFFSPMSHPFYAVTFTVDVTELVDWCRRTGCSFYCAMVYFSTKALNSVEAFRYYTADGDLFLLDRRIPSFTDLHPGSALFHIVTLDCGDDPVDFCRRAKAKSAAQTTFLDQASETQDLIYFTCLPWVELTAMTNERDLDVDDAVPRIGWGRYVPREGRLVLHLSLEVNHRFVDGVHIGQFARALEEELAALADA